jgi:methionyl aminopeptidase
MVICKSPARAGEDAPAGLIVWGALEKMRAMVKPGDFDQGTRRVRGRLHASSIMRVPAFKGYRGYPGSVCTSINQEVVHGIPSAVAAGARGRHSFDGFWCRVGRLLCGCRADRSGGKDRAGARKAAASHPRIARPGDRAKCGPATGSAMFPPRCRSGSKRTVFGGARVRGPRHRHQDARRAPASELRPPGQGPRLQEGMVLAIEPMVNAGGPGVRVLEDDWTAVTATAAIRRTSSTPSPSRRTGRGF